MQAFLEENALWFGFYYGIQKTADIAAYLNTEGIAWAARLLTEAEMDRFAQFRNQKRKVEWLAGRMAAKTAFSRFAQAEDGFQRDPEVSVLYEASGAPIFKDYPEVTLSISHSNEYALAVAAGFGIGVDIERIEPRPMALTDYFFCEDERRLLENDCPLQTQKEAMITWLWSRKEALSKFLRLGGKLDFSRLNVVHDWVKVEESTHNEVHLVSGECAGYCISLAL
jgi:4'-phosphopantetheinyl transferase